MSDFVFWAYFFKFFVLMCTSACISELIMLFLKHLGYPQTKKTKWYLTLLIFTINFQLAWMLHIFIYG